MIDDRIRTFDSGCTVEGLALRLCIVQARLEAGSGMLGDINNVNCTILQICTQQVVKNTSVKWSTESFEDLDEVLCALTSKAILPKKGRQSAKMDLEQKEQNTHKARSTVCH